MRCVGGAVLHVASTSRAGARGGRLELGGRRRRASSASGVSVRGLLVVRRVGAHPCDAVVRLMLIAAFIARLFNFQFTRTWEVALH